MVQLAEQHTAGTPQEILQHRPTKFAFLGVGQAVPPEDIAEFAAKLFPDTSQSCRYRNRRAGMSSPVLKNLSLLKQPSKIAPNGDIFPTKFQYCFWDKNLER